ncbi:MAG: hypothetical protein Q8Q17_01055, partial [bacterium]|nr:hypothetical protein [bacterium]
PTKKLGEENLKILVLAKAMFWRGCEFIHNTDGISRMLAMHNFDNALEIVLKQVAEKKGIKPGKEWEWKFSDLLKCLDNDTQKLQINGLHKQRNLIQHHGDIPDIETVIKYMGYTEDLLKDVFQKEFNISYADVSLSSLIKAPELKRLFSKAERFFEEGKYKNAIKQSEEAFVRAVFDFADIFLKAGVLTGYFKGGDEFGEVIKDNYAERYEGKDCYEFAKEISKAFLQLGQATTTMQFLGEYRADFIEHRRRVENLENIHNEKLKEEARRSLDFVVNLFLKWQEEKIL